MEPGFDYDNALYCTLWGHWDNLIDIMAKSSDDLLAKKIETFLAQLHFCPDEGIVLAARNDLLHYIDHAMHMTPMPTIEI